MRSVDLAIVGGGPAGAAAAIAARQAHEDLEVLLIDRARFPRDKACGDGIGPECVVALADLGLEDLLDDLDPVHRVEVRAPDGGEVSGPVPRPGWVLPRFALDDRLHRAAVAAGAEPVTARVGPVRESDDAVEIPGVCRARWVIGADGANSRIRRAAGFPSGHEQPTGLAMRGYADGPTLDALLIRFVDDAWPAYAWAFPLGEGRANVGYGTFDRANVAGRDDLEASIRRHLPEFTVAGDTLRAHHLPLASVRPALGRKRILLVGDAANLVHPLTGEGITYALVSGRLAGAAVGAFTRTGGDGPGGRYEQAIARELGRHLRHVRFAARLFRHRTPVNLSVAAAAADAAMLGQLAEFALGTGTITPGLVRGLTGAAVRRRAWQRTRASSESRP
ncbi:MAG: geranylgeranyl reductase family protein [Nitriliruptorales bacterium]|nr:geranylgeranyl reductase family protein [Nitriliruptorales bacterium]